ncbi:hypothetical protein [Nakamurella antarctica]|nr:hypothetical protein [Nakamurella antarctica]
MISDSRSGVRQTSWHGDIATNEMSAQTGMALSEVMAILSELGQWTHALV